MDAELRRLAESIAAHPRFEARRGMRLVQTGPAECRLDRATVARVCDEDEEPAMWPEGATLTIEWRERGFTSDGFRGVPDLHDDATVGVLLGQLHELCRRVSCMWVETGARWDLSVTTNSGHLITTTARFRGEAVALTLGHVWDLEPPADRPTRVVGWA